MNELFVVMATWTEELAVFLICFNFRYLSDLIDCMEIWVFQVFKFEIVKSVFLLDGLHLIEDYIFVFRELGVELIIICIELTLHFPQLLASIENTTPTRSQSLGTFPFRREITQRQLLTSTSARPKQFFLFRARLLLSNRPVLLLGFLSFLRRHRFWNHTLILKLGLCLLNTLIL